MRGVTHRIQSGERVALYSLPFLCCSFKRGGRPAAAHRMHGGKWNEDGESQPEWVIHSSPSKKEAKKVPVAATEELLAAAKKKKRDPTEVRRGIVPTHRGRRSLWTERKRKQFDGKTENRDIRFSRGKERGILKGNI